jgi:anaerobic ribonucleoside-triphosphate reductase activating protein
MVFTGYTWEELQEQAGRHKGWPELLANTDILVDGRYEKNQRSLNLRFRGSRNQRALDVQASLASGQAVLFDL